MQTTYTVKQLIGGGNKGSAYVTSNHSTLDATLNPSGTYDGDLLPMRDKETEQKIWDLARSGENGTIIVGVDDSAERAKEMKKYYAGLDQINKTMRD